mgnify:CR=1 FL=1
MLMNCLGDFRLLQDPVNGPARAASTKDRRESIERRVYTGEPAPGVQPPEYGSTLRWVLAHQRATLIAFLAICVVTGVLFARAEGILPAPEANHAVRGAIDEALRCREEGKSQTILFNLCGHGHFDMQAYIDFFGGKLKDLEYDEAELAMALAGLPSMKAA